MEIGESLIRVISALAVVLSLMVMVTLVLRRLLPNQLLPPGQAPLVRVLGSSYLGPRKSIMVVAVADEVLIVGSTPTQLVPLGQLRDPAQIERILAPRPRSNAQAEPNPIPPRHRTLQWLGRVFKLFEHEGVWRVSAFPPTARDPRHPALRSAAPPLGSLGARSGAEASVAEPAARGARDVHAQEPRMPR